MKSLRQHVTESLVNEAKKYTEKDVIDTYETISGKKLDTKKYAIEIDMLADSYESKEAFIQAIGKIFKIK